MNVLAAETAAASRVGLTSSAAIEPEWSLTSISDAVFVGTRWVTRGRARAMASNAAAVSSSAAGMWRGQRGATWIARLDRRHGWEADHVARARAGAGTGRRRPRRG